MITEPRKVIGGCLAYLVAHPEDLPDLFVPEHYACRHGDLWVHTQRAEDCLHMVVREWSKLGYDDVKNTLRSTDSGRLLAAVEKLHQVARESGMIPASTTSKKKAGEQVDHPITPTNSRGKLLMSMVENPQTRPGGRGMKHSAIASGAGVKRTTAERCFQQLRRKGLIQAARKEATKLTIAGSKKAHKIRDKLHFQTLK